MIFRPIDRKAITSYYRVMGRDFNPQELEQHTELRHGTFTKYHNPLPSNKPRGIGEKNLDLLTKGISMVASDFGCPFPMWKDLLIIPEKSQVAYAVVKWFTDDIALPGCNDFFQHLSSTIRLMSQHQATTNAASGNLELSLECMRLITPLFYQKTFLGGSYIINADGIVNAAFTPLDPEKKQLRSKSVANRPYMGPAMSLESNEGGYISDRLKAIDPQRESAPIIVAIANICRGATNEHLGAVDVVVDVLNSPLTSWLKLLITKLQMGLGVDHNHPASIAIYDRKNQSVAQYTAGDTSLWDNDDHHFRSAVFSLKNSDDTKFSLTEFDNSIYSCAPLDAAPGYMLLIRVKKPVCE